MTADDLARAAERAAAHRADGGAVDDSEMPYRVTGSKVWLSREAREWAKHYGMTEAEFGRYLMRAEKLREAGVTVEHYPQGDDSDEVQVTSYAGDPALSGEPSVYPFD